MDRNQTRLPSPHPLSNKPTSQELLQRTGRAILLWGAVFALAILAWLDVRSTTLALLSLGVLHALLTLTLERALTIFPLAEAWRYRLAFLVSVGLCPLYLLLQWAGFALGPLASQPELTLSGALLRLVVAIFGAFAGGLLATALHDGLWENNSPPSETARLDVYRLHQQLAGAPQPIPWNKRTFDLLVALFGLAFSAPVWLVSIFLIWLEDPGPLLFVKNSVGRGGMNFHQFKLRTMLRGAEEHTGPVLSQQGDPRVLLFGRVLRKTALDELPQLINILLGQMSFVGPRPQRTILVREYLQYMPEYAQRHRVLPGIAGLAQVAGDYYLTPRQKLRYDLLYIRYNNLCFDLKLLFLAFLITFWLRWKKEWNGRLPRKLLRYGSPKPERF